MSFVLLVVSAVLGIFQTVMTTTSLDVRQWLICTAVLREDAALYGMIMTAISRKRIDS